MWEFVINALADSPHPAAIPCTSRSEPFGPPAEASARVIWAIDDDALVVTIAAVEHRRDVHR